jgi:hypothetical protein
MVFQTLPASVLALIAAGLTALAGTVARARPDLLRSE